MAEKMILEEIEQTEEQRRFFEIVLPPATKTELVTIRVTAETKRALEELSKKYNLSMSEVLRQVTKQGLELVNRKK